MTTASVSSSRQAVDVDDRNELRRFGLIVLATDLASKKDLYRLLPDRNASVHPTSVTYATGKAG